MADDGTLRVSTSVDTSGLKAGQSEAQSITAATVADLRTQYQQASAAVRSALKDMTDAQAAFAKGAAEGNSAAISILAEYRGEAARTVQVEAEVKAALDRATRSLNDQIGANTRLISSQMEMRYGAQLLARDLGVPIPRALASIASTSETLGPIMQAALPVGIAAFMGEALGKVVVKTIDLYDNTVNLKQVNEELAETTHRVFESIEQDIQRANRAEEQYIRLTQGAAAAEAYAITVLGEKHVDLSKLLDPKKLGAMSDQGQKEISDFFLTKVMTKDTRDRVAEIRNRVEELKKSIASFDDAKMKSIEQTLSGGGYSAAPSRTKQDLQAEVGFLEDAAIKFASMADTWFKEDKLKREQQKRAVAEDLAESARTAIALLKAQGRDSAAAEREIWQGVAKEAAGGGLATRAVYIEALSHIGGDLKKGMHDAEEALREADREQLAQMEADHQLNKAELIHYWEDRAQIGPQYKKREIEIEATLGRLHQELEKSWTEAVRRTEEQVGHAAKEAKKKLEEWQEKMVEVAREGDKLAQEIADSATKAEAERMRAAATAYSEQQTGALQSHRVDIEAQYKMGGPLQSVSDLNPFSGGEALKQLQAQQQVDEQLLAEKMRLAQQEVSIDKWQQQQQIGDQNELAKKLDQDQKTALAATQAYNLRLRQDHLSLMTALEQNWQQYFNIVNQGMLRGINGLISGNETFAKAMRQTLVQLLESFADYEARTLLIEAETKLHQAVLGKTTQATTAIAEIQSNAAVAASATFASISAIPIVGPEMAPAAAAAAYAEVLSAYGTLAALETGGYVPKGGLAILHPNETVINSPVTSMLTNIANQGGVSSGHTFNVNQTNHYGELNANGRSSANKSANDALRMVQKGLRRANISYR
jgi:hypothetical protein